MPDYRRRRPALGWGGVLRTVIDTGHPNEVSGGWLGRGWQYYGTNGGGNYLPFFGAPAVRSPSSWGPASSTPVGEESAFPGTSPNTSWAVLGGWVDGTGIYPAIIDSWGQKTFSGLTVGNRTGFNFEFPYVLDTGGGNVFGEIEGETIVRFSALNSGPTFWTFDGKPVVNDGYISTIVPVSGDVIVRLGWENMGPAGANGQGMFGSFELADLDAAGGLRPNLLIWGTPAGAGAVTTWPRRGRGTATSPRTPSGRRATSLKPPLDMLRMFVPYIPQVDRERVGGPNGLDASGADGALGWRAALEYGRNGGIYTYYPNQDDLEADPVDCRLVAPLGGRYDRSDPSLLRGLDLVLATANAGDVFPEY